MRAVVTGAGGFLGGRLAHQLKDAGHDVVGFQRGSYPALEAAGIQCIRGDLTNKEDVEGAIKGADAVFHVAAKVDFLGPAEIFERINIGGTDHVIDACKKHNVERLVYCSTPSVTLSGTHDVNVDESAPYAATYPAHYPRTKAEAERHALAANGTSLDGGGQLRTCALRPHFVFGPGDQNILPSACAPAASASSATATTRSTGAISTMRRRRTCSRKRHCATRGHQPPASRSSSPTAPR